MSSAVVAQVEHQIGDAGLLEALDGGQQVVVVGGVEAVVDDVSDVRTLKYLGADDRRGIQTHRRDLDRLCVRLVLGERDLQPLRGGDQARELRGVGLLGRGFAVNRGDDVAAAESGLGQRRFGDDAQQREPDLPRRPSRLVYKRHKGVVADTETRHGVVLLDTVVYTTACRGASLSR